MTTTSKDEARFYRRELINIILHDNALTQQPNRFAVIAKAVREYENTIEVQTIENGDTVYFQNEDHQNSDGTWGMTSNIVAVHPATPSRRSAGLEEAERYDRMTKLYGEISTISKEHPGSNGHGQWIAFIPVATPEFFLC